MFRKFNEQDKEQHVSILRGEGLDGRGPECFPGYSEERQCQRGWGLAAKVFVVEPHLHSVISESDSKMNRLMEEVSEETRRLYEHSS